jgi:hypothetical protein
MSGKSNVFGFLAAIAIGWPFLTMFLVGVYHLSRWASTYIGLGEEPFIIGLLGSVAFVWCYTYFDMREADRRIDDRIDRLEEALCENKILGSRVTR